MGPEVDEISDFGMRISPLRGTSTFREFPVGKPRVRAT
jgi:hypothetical protein